MDFSGRLPENSIFDTGESASMEPVAPQNRIVLMDVLRGVAVLGIFLINMPLYVAPGSAFFHWDEMLLWTGQADRLALLFLHIFAQGKFYTLFSFLFGLGFGLQMKRAEERNFAGFVLFYRRRLFVLLAIGVAHLTLIWWGDVLHIYALLGFALLQFRERSDKALLVWAACLTLIPLVVATGVFTQRSFAGTEAKAQEAAKTRKERQERATRVEEDQRVHATGSILQITQFRLKRDLNRLGSEAGWATELFATFLVGLWVSRRRILEEPRLHRPLLQTLAYFALPAGLAFSALDLTYVYLHPGTHPPLWQSVMSLLREFVARPAMAFGYAAVILLIGQRRWMEPLAAVGRMALTNYLMHSVVFTTVANAYGLGLYGKIPPATGLALSVGFFTLQIPFSVWWLRHHRQGPVEQLWRRLSYETRS